MARARKGKELTRRDAAEYERYSLDYLIKKELQAEDDTRYVSVEEALNDKSVFQVQSNRNVTRVLFISHDESLLNPTKQSLDGYIDISELFDEVHILILREGIKPKKPVLRVDDNVWIYTANDKDWWRTPAAGKKLANEQLSFAGGFRPDMIVARDPFESAYLALSLGKKYHRPVQIHVLENFYSPAFLKKSRHNRWRKWLAKYTLMRADSVRTATNAMRNRLQSRFSFKDLEVLPKFNNYEALAKVTVPEELKDKFRRFSFIIVCVGRLEYDSRLYQAIDAARFGLKNPRIGLIILGDGPARSEYEERTKIFGIREQVVFETKAKDIVPYLKLAHVLVVPEVDHDSDEVALQGAAVGVPTILAANPAREDVFVDNESTLFCEMDNIDEFSLKLNILMNDIPLRRHMADLASEMIKIKFHEDPIKYRKAYRESIEKVLFLDSPDNSSPE